MTSVTSISSITNLINDHLDSIPIQQKSDFLIVSKALESLKQFVEDLIFKKTDKPFTSIDNANESLKDRVSYLKELNEQLLSLKELADNPNIYVKEPEQHSFRELIDARIQAKIKEFIELEKDEIAGNRYIAELKVKKAEGKKYQQTIMTKKEPEQNSVARFMSAEDFEQWSNYKSLSSNLDKLKEYQTNGIALQETFKAEVLKLIEEKAGRKEFTREEIKGFLPLYQSFLDESILKLSPLKELITAEQFYFLDADKLTVFGSTKLAENFGWLLRETRTNFNDYKDLDESVFSIIIDFYETVMEYHLKIDVIKLYKIPYPKLSMLLKLSKTAKKLMAKGVSFEYLEELSLNNLEFILGNSHYKNKLAELVKADITSATVSKLSNGRLKRVLDNLETQIPLLKIFQEGLHLQKSTDINAIQTFIGFQGLKDYITVSQFQTLDEAKMLMLFKYKSHLLKLFKCGMTFQDFIQLNKKTYSLMIKYIGSVEKIMEKGIYFSTLLHYPNEDLKALLKAASPSRNKFNVFKGKLKSMDD